MPPRLGPKWRAPAGKDALVQLLGRLLVRRLAKQLLQRRKLEGGQQRGARKPAAQRHAGSSSAAAELKPASPRPPASAKVCALSVRPLIGRLNSQGRPHRG